jgi:DNA polymerase-4
MLCRACGSAGFAGGDTPPLTCPACESHNLRWHAELFDLQIAHVDCDAFYASVEKRDNPDLADKPVIVGGRERGVVAAACYIARKYGVRSAMPTWTALQKCPDAIVIKPRMAHYTEVSRAIRVKMMELTPLVQPLSIDEAFLDLSGTAALHGCSPAVALMRMQNTIRDEIGVSVSVGLAATKSLAKMASDRDKPDGFFVVGKAQAKLWLAPQPVSVLFGLGKAAVRRLNAAGFHTCGDLVTADLRNLGQILGKSAGNIQKLAAGIDSRAVTPDRAAKSVSNETTFYRDLSNRDELEAELEALCLKVSGRLKAGGIAGGRVTLKLKRPDHQLLTRSQTLQSRTDKAHLLFAVARDLLRGEIGPNRRFRLIGCGVDQLGPPGQPSLLDLEGGLSDRQNKLEAALDEVNRKLGQDAVQTGRMFQRKKRRAPAPDTGETE